MKNKTIIFIAFLLIISILINIYLFNSFNEKDIINKERNIFLWENNINLIKNLETKDDVIVFKTQSSLPESMLFYSIKNKDKNKWNLYWSNVYEQFSWVTFSKQDFEEYVDKTFKEIQTNSLEADISNKYLLDWGIFFSLASIDEKIELCKKYFSIKRIKDDYSKYWVNVPEDTNINITKCINYSYFYEAVINNKIDPCYKIDDKLIWDDMKSNCIELLKW